MKKNEKKEFKIGDKIKLTEEQKNNLARTADIVNGYQIMMDIIASAMKKHHDELWNVIYSYYPELRDYQAYYNPVAGIIKIKSKRD